MPEEKKDGDDPKVENSDNVKTSAEEVTSKSDRKKYADWPVREIKEPHDNDVLYGRGGGTNHHPGNKRYRKIVEDRKIDYVNCKRLDKPLVALGIIRDWRGQDPPGRFLKLDEKTGLWCDVGDKKAREKTSQALREKAPLIREQQEQARYGNGEDGDNTDSDDDDDGTTTKATRFAAGTNLNGNDTTKPVLARDHSLGREYLEPNEAMTLEGFSWREPLAGEDAASSDFLRASSIGSYSHHSMPPPMYPPSSRMGSHSSMGTIGTMPPMPGDPYRYSSHGSIGPPPPPLPHPNSYEHATSGERNMRYPSWCRYDSWGSASGAPPPVPGYSYPPPHTMSWSRDHSLGQNPLSNGSVSQPAYPNAFDSRTGTWGPVPPPPPHYYTPPPDGAPSHYVSGSNNGSRPNEMVHPHYRPNGSPQRDLAPDQYRSNGVHPHRDNNPQHYPSGAGSPPPPSYYAHSKDHAGRSMRPHDYSKSPLYPNASARHQDHPKSPSYSIDPAVASQWSGRDPRDIAITLSGGSEDQDNFSISPKSSFQVPAKVPKVPKPDIVKRATSNQNETVETKPDLIGPSVKRAALNRDNSMASNRLKEQYIPGYFDSEKEVKILSANFRQSTIGIESDGRPVPISRTERSSTIENIAMDLMVRPVNIGNAGRSSTIDALALDFDDVFERPVQLNEPSMEDVVADLRQPVPRPSAITSANRLTTTEFLDLVNEPIEEDDDDFGGDTESI